MSLNWIDWVIIILVLYDLYQGWRVGFIALGISLVSFAVSLWVAVIYQAPVSGFFSEKFGVNALYSSIMSYVTIVFSVQLIVNQLLHVLISRLPKKIETSVINDILGAVVSAVNGLTIIALVLFLITVLPLRGTVRTDIQKSVIGGNIVSWIEQYGGPIRSTMDEVRKTATQFMTVLPGSRDSLALDVAPKSADMEVYDEGERELLALVNKERLAVGAGTLTVDVRIVSVARAHSRDMFERRYFSHYSPEGKTLGDRLAAGGVKYSLAGENLAYAPDIKSAHEGLMNSPEHKKNILDPQFRHVGIGIIRTDSYGIMVTQDFTN